MTRNRFPARASSPASGPRNADETNETKAELMQAQM